MTTIEHTTTPASAVDRRRAYGRAISWILVAAFTLSAGHTVYSAAVGLGDPRFTVTTPVAWIFYALGFGSAILARRRGRVAQWVLAGYLAALLGVAVFWYPTTFTVAQQTVFGWFENDVYTGLLMIALFLAVQRLRGVALVPR